MSLVFERDANGAETATTKASNPKDAAATGRRISFAAVPVRALAGAALALGGEGAHKYGRHNYRIAGVRASVYYDASLRHIFAWWEGEDIDPASHLHHIDKAIAGLLVLRDAQLGGMCTDDRPPPVDSRWVDRANTMQIEIGARMAADFGPAVPPFTREDVPHVPDVPRTTAFVHRG